MFSVNEKFQDVAMGQSREGPGENRQAFLQMSQGNCRVSKEQHGRLPDGGFEVRFL